MKSKYTDSLNLNCPWQEYPRPQMERKTWMNLNGKWQAQRKGKKEENFEIIVPFSMECEINGNHSPLLPEESLILSKEFIFDEELRNQKVLLHIDAVDQRAKILLNNKKVGMIESGFIPHTFDITEMIDSKNLLEIEVQDDTDYSWRLKGKQKLSPKGIWYSPQSGIWQTVWLEVVPKNYIDSLVITPLFDSKQVQIQVNSSGRNQVVIRVENQQFEGFSNHPIFISFSNPHEWTVDDPYLYSVDIKMGEDEVKSYFGFRCFTVEKDSHGQKRLCLNHHPLFHSGLLDQGYCSDGMLTFPCDEAMIDDILLAKSMGFNVLRKHIKVEPLRWYYHCDRLGLLVWQDMVNGGENYNLFTISSPLFTHFNFRDNHYSLFGRENGEGRLAFQNDLKKMIHHLYNCVCIAMWVPFNEGWGQFDSCEAVKIIQSIDTTRYIDHASGWHDQKIGDFKSIHVYFKQYHYQPDKVNRLVLLSEAGGFNLKVEGHSYNQKNFGYQKMNSQEEFEKEILRFYSEEILVAKKQGLGACIYTQLSDVETELNGLVTYDRKVVKVNPNVLYEINQRLIKE